MKTVNVSLNFSVEIPDDQDAGQLYAVARENELLLMQLDTHNKVASTDQWETAVSEE